ncbi:conserved Plasmodium protein, unknown function [Plasmodium knowlesi strain H]|uniref:Potassium channel tetramerisation-type BTB domain-containing protein n=3 Tax=Plasmodium knowlesi TaxID=5850 RepID=A0A1A7VZS2_PLAKH|nr:BTB/POZ domain-containing protein, putative [Plasmodium knowlesi strain H]OTN64206.1 Uncharacterized protein PKNOH_S140277000 [Plasmodium knowlesi]CAA9991182.1 BTB/POZ domain-containing protein, putative [Plasmodium knowlesi strain H]SBO27156.1 conserved Plasmodium protein, unknown function [Plasmodium knowlesi strain H]SBO29389.1 conserved Plasmodium protein, unknown function [Plasmodium knowlesi strain H]VVS80656.1 BTB/POZ domain-containing protein, putative [Plasmodium knowlesi strain H]
MDSIEGDNVISINVGGTIYMTTLNLICKYRNSRLCEIVLEKLKAMPDLDNHHKRKEIFIDRNGNRFEYILDFLRDGVLICENDINVLTRILIEAVYFKLFSLIKILKKKIQLLYSNMGSNVNKNIFKNIIGTLEEKKQNKIKSKEKNNSISRMLNKISAHIKKHKEVKCCIVKKKKNHNVHSLNKVNLLNELNDGDESFTKGEVNMANYKLLSSAPRDSGKEEKEIVFVKDLGDKEKNGANIDFNNEGKVNTQHNLPEIILPNPSTLSKYTKNLDYNITNNFKNEEDKLKNKNNANGSNQINCLVKNIERKGYSPVSLSPNGNLKSGDNKTLSFAKSTSIFIYGKEDEIAHNGIKDPVGTSTQSSNRSLSPTSIGGANYLGYSSFDNYTSTSDHLDRACYKYNNYTYNNMNNPRGQILVHSEIDDIEETSPFPILSNVNLGEQIFSTTVDF